MDDFQTQLRLKHSADVVCLTGVGAIFTLALLNGSAALLHGQAPGVFVAGTLMAFLAALIVYVVAQLHSAGIPVEDKTGVLQFMALMVLPSALSLLLFCIGVLRIT